MTFTFPQLSTANIESLQVQGNVLPIVVEFAADTETPVSLFHKLTQNREGSMLLESIHSPEKRARYSFILLSPSETITDLNEVKEKLKSFRNIPIPNLPIFTGGYVGTINYETVGEFEPTLKLKGEGKVQFDRYDTVVAFDHFQSKILFITNLFLKNNIKDEMAKAKNTLEGLYEKFKYNQSNLGLLQRAEKSVEPKSNTTKEAFKNAVIKAKKGIVDGEIFQIVLSQKFSTPFSEDPFTLYRALRMVNPSPYMFYINRGDRQIIGASPETLVRLEEGTVSIAPIAGTKPRGRNEEQDEANAKDLLSDEKELAEHRMLLDLGRNDIGRVSEIGTVELHNPERIEKYSHVMHIVSDVQGTLRKDCDALDAFASCFPAGTLSGAPKIRAMQMIAELEPEARDIYGGGMGYFGFSGNMDFAIAIRTFVVENGTASIQVGAGIVQDSIPEKEYEETMHKAEANFQALSYTAIH
ncbi:MAG: chorismate-binding protein [Candidatus Peregrinibacteria bacterium]|nr:chorismate-binding protein [Candidatus Peregrinibacteria bacterium]